VFYVWRVLQLLAVGFMRRYLVICVRLSEGGLDASAAQSIVGTAEHYAQFVKLARDRIVELGITYATVDEICGFPDRYTAILLSGGKRMSVWSFFTLTRALALLPMFGHDAPQLERLKHRSSWTPRRTRPPAQRRPGGGRKRKRPDLTAIAPLTLGG
jgi:hypothetical protein